MYLVRFGVGAIQHQAETHGPVTAKVIARAMAKAGWLGVYVVGPDGKRVNWRV